MHRFFRPAVLLLAVTVTPALADETLTMNGKKASTTVRTLNGSAYVKLSDVAKALGMVVVKRPGGYEITKTGGTNQVQATTSGKVGDVLFDGYWRFQVQSVETPDSYTARYMDDNGKNLHFDRNTHKVHTDSPYKMVIVHCRMTNGQKTAQTFWIAPVSERTINNALTDTTGESYPPDCFDLDGSVAQSKSLLPGAKTDFAILFRVPADTQLKDLVFTLQNNDSRPGNDVRVSLTP